MRSRLADSYLLVLIGVAAVRCSSQPSGPINGSADGALGPADAPAAGGRDGSPASESGSAGDGAPEDGGDGSPDGGVSGVDAAGARDGGRADASQAARSCANPDPSWLLCEDFERGSGDFDAWYQGSEFLDSPGADDRGRVTLASSEVHGGGWALYMPAASSAGYRGASMDWYACDGATRTNCPLRSFDELFFRVWVRFAADHRSIHHFLTIGGSQPDDFWYHGTAGCLPDGVLHMNTTVDVRAGSHETFFYTYFPEMSCDTRCDRYANVAQICADCESKGLPTCTMQQQCCWGNELAPPQPVPLPVGRWFCLEMRMKANTPGSHDGDMEYWIDGAVGHRKDGMMWRTSPTLALNRVRLQHYNETSDVQGHSNRVWFDDMVVSTARIGCD